MRAVLSSPVSDAMWQAHRAAPTLETRNALAEFYLSLTVLAARTVQARNSVIRDAYTVEELAAIAVLGLIEAVERFDPARIRLFETLAWPRMIGAIKDQVRRDNMGPRDKGRRLLSLESLFEDAGPSLREMVAVDGDPAERVCGRSDSRTVALVEALACLPRTEAAVIRLVDYERVPMHVVGEWWGVIESRVCQIHTKAVRHLRSLMQSRLRAAA